MHGAYRISQFCEGVQDLGDASETEEERQLGGIGTGLQAGFTALLCIHPILDDERAGSCTWSPDHPNRDRAPLSGIKPYMLAVLRPGGCGWLAAKAEQVHDVSRRSTLWAGLRRRMPGQIRKPEERRTHRGRGPGGGG